ncbi:hypothetical protein HGR_03944, partial [Hylemonella gracilis ATCC 19624]
MRVVVGPMKKPAEAGFFVAWRALRAVVISSG